MQTSHFRALRRRLLPLAALVAATGLGGCVATAPAPYGYNYYPGTYTYNYPANYPAPYYGSSYTTTRTYPGTYPLYSPYFHGYESTQSGNGRG